MLNLFILFHFWGLVFRCFNMFQHYVDGIGKLSKELLAHWEGHGHVSTLCLDRAQRSDRGCGWAISGEEPHSGCGPAEDETFDLQNNKERRDMATMQNSDVHHWTVWSSAKLLNYWVLMRSCFARELRSSKFWGFTANALEPLESCSTTITFSWTVLGYSWAVGSSWLAGRAVYICVWLCFWYFLRLLGAHGGTKEREKASAKKLEDQVEMVWLLSRLQMSIRRLNEHLSISNYLNVHQGSSHISIPNHDSNPVTLWSPQLEDFNGEYGESLGLENDDPAVQPCIPGASPLALALEALHLSCHSGAPGSPVATRDSESREPEAPRHWKMWCWEATKINTPQSYGISVNIPSFSA